jgi:PKD repeat protein
MTKTPLILAILIAIVSCSKDESTPDIAPVSEFTYSVDAINKKIVNFQNASHYLNANSKYIWTFGDGDSSALENPKHTYANEGIYSVVLKVINGSQIDCSDQKVVATSVVVDTSAVPPVVMFGYSQKGRQVQFQNASSGVDAHTTYAWTYGDGDTARKENTSHLYSNDGYYSVVLKVTTNYKSYSCSKTIYVSEANIPVFDTIAPVPSFSYYYVGKVVYFVNTSSYTTSATKYSWNFGNGSTDTKENPSLPYTDGTYTVVLKVSNSKYTLSCSKQISVPENANYILNPKPVAKFVYSQEGKGIHFQSASSNIFPNSTFSWTFGDGETAKEENPFHAYATAGKYSAVLKVTNQNISDSYSLEITIP